MVWKKKIRNGKMAAEFVDNLLEKKEEICTQEAFDILKKSGCLFSFKIKDPKKLGHILKSSQRFEQKYKYSSYCGNAATHWKRRN